MMKVIELLNKIANNEIKEGTRLRMEDRNINLILQRDEIGELEFGWEDMPYDYQFGLWELNDKIEIIDTKEV